MALNDRIVSDPQAQHTGGEQHHSAAFSPHLEGRPSEQLNEWPSEQEWPSELIAQAPSVTPDDASFTFDEVSTTAFGVSALCLHPLPTTQDQSEPRLLTTHSSTRLTPILLSEKTC
jgi:hypothetical protein